MNDKSLTLVGHLDELRKRLIVIVATVIIGTSISYNYIGYIVELLIRPVGNLSFIYLSPPDLFIAYVKIAIATGCVLTMPIILYQVWRFVLPGITKKQRIYVILSNLASMIFFLTGASFAYFYIVPISIRFFTKLARAEIQPYFSFASYTSFVGSMLLAFGITFQLPILVMLLTQFNLITPQFLKKSRKIIVLLIFVLAAILTPPDVVSQTLLAAPMLLLLELSIILSSLIYKRKNN